MTDGDWSFYFVVTPIYGSSALRLINSEINDAFEISLDNGSGLPVMAASGTTSTGGASDRPTAGIPCLISLRMDHSASLGYWGWRNQGGANGGGIYPTMVGSFPWSPTNPLAFDANSDVRRDGMEFFGNMFDSTGNNALNYLAQPGFIIHEILAYPKFLSSTDDLDMQQWFEDRYGV